MSPACFENQGFIVTGGTHGLGRAVIALAAQRGAHVFFSGPPGSDQVCARVVADAESAGAGERVFGITADLSREEEADRFLEMAAAQLPEIRGLVSIFADTAEDTPGSMIEMSLADWNRAVIAELRAAFLVSQRVLQEFLANGKGGRIVYLASTTCPRVTGQAVHLTTQHALRALCRSIAKEYGRREITCNVVAAQEHSAKDSSLSMLTAETVLFLASDEASFVNGEMVLAAGGGLDAEYHPSMGGTYDVKR